MALHLSTLLFNHYLPLVPKTFIPPPSKTAIPIHRSLLIHSFLLVPGSKQLLFCLHEFTYSGYFFHKQIHGMLCVWLLSLSTVVLTRIHMVACITVLPSCVWLTCTPLYMHAMFCVFFYPVMHMWAVSTCWLLSTVLPWPLFTTVCSSACFHLFGVYA